MQSLLLSSNKSIITKLILLGPSIAGPYIEPLRYYI